MGEGDGRNSPPFDMGIVKTHFLRNFCILDTPTQGERWWLLAYRRINGLYLRMMQDLFAQFHTFQCVFKIGFRLSAFPNTIEEVSVHLESTVRSV